MPIINPDYTPPIEMTFDEGKPIRSEQGTMLAGNPIAIAEGAPGAPKVSGLALGNVYLGTLTATITPAAIVDLARFETLRLTGHKNSTALRVAFSSNNGATWGGYTSITSTSAGMFDLVLSRSAGEARAIDLVNGLTIFTPTIPAGANAVRFVASESAGVASFHAFLLSGQP